MTTPSDRKRPRDDQPTFFELTGGSPPPPRPGAPASGRPPARTANPQQVRLRAGPLDALIAEDLVDLTRVAQAGMRVRASAGAASFRRRPTLEEALVEAEAQIEALRSEIEEDPTAGDRRERAARERAARERAARIKQAL